jgi:hypothetical protein
MIRKNVKEFCRASMRARQSVQLILVRYEVAALAPSTPPRMPEETRTGDTVRNSDIGTIEAFEIVLSQVSARAIEAVCLRTANSLDLETLMTSSSISLCRHTKPFSSRCERE